MFNLDVSSIYDSILADIQSRVPVSLSHSKALNKHSDDITNTQSCETILNKYISGDSDISDSPEISAAIENAVAAAAKKYNVDEYAIKYIVGHEISDITEKVYTQRETEWLKSEIEKIK